MPQGKTRVVIIGAGFGGLEAAKTLRRAEADVIVIDRNNHHCFQPLLYQVATAALSPAEIAWPIRHILRPQRNATVLMEDVQSIDANRKCLHTEFGDVPYDYLVIATGAMHSYFGHDEWADVANGDLPVRWGRHDWGRDGRLQRRNRQRGNRRRGNGRRGFVDADHIDVAGRTRQHPVGIHRDR